MSEQIAALRRVFPKHFGSPEPDKKLSPEARYDAFFVAAGKRYGIRPNVLKAVGKIESNFNPKARGKKTRFGRAHGMMQVMPGNFKQYKITKPLDAADNINGAAKLFKDYYNAFGGDLRLTLAAYNHGIGNLRDYASRVGKTKKTVQYEEIERFLPSETKNYVPKVMKALRDFDSRDTVKTRIPSKPKPKLKDSVLMTRLKEIFPDRFGEVGSAVK